MDQLTQEIEAHRAKALKNVLKPCVRLNGTSDVQWEKLTPSLFTRFFLLDTSDVLLYNLITERGINNMSMSNYANHVVTIDADLLKKVCKKEYKAFEKALETAEIDLDTWAEALDTEQHGDYAIGMYDAYEKLRDAFRKNTKLILSLGYHNPEMAERGDDVSGGFWEVRSFSSDLGRKIADMILKELNANRHLMSEPQVRNFPSATLAYVKTTLGMNEH